MTGCLSAKVRAVQALLAKQQQPPPLSLLISLDDVRSAQFHLTTAFPIHWYHAFAIKCNPSSAFLQAFLAGGGQFSVEAASEGEVEAALTALLDKDMCAKLPTGLHPLSTDPAFSSLVSDPSLRSITAQGRRLVFDAPLKRRRELRRVVAVGGSVNVDNFQELAVLESVMDELPAETPCLSHTHGVRINPQVGAGSMVGYSTGTATAKFGVGIVDAGSMDSLVGAYGRNPWLSSIMCHVGSQGVPIDLAVAGIRKTVDAALTINKRLGRRAVRSIDIGGGLPVNFASDEVTPTFDEYAAALRATVPELFDSSTFETVTTEFGRALVAKAGFFLSRIEYTKETGGRPILIQNVGADIAIRTVYLPKQWPLRVTLLRADGTAAYGGDGVADVDGEVVPTDVAGPCCIQADIIAHERPLPKAEPNDWVLVHDVGGYYHASHSRFNLRQMPDVWGYAAAKDGSGVRLAQIQRGETIEDTLRVFAAVPGEDVTSLVTG